jgi:methylase of polypeptide subunit release factors
MNSCASNPFRIDETAIARIRKVFAVAEFSEVGVFRHLQFEDTVRVEPREIPRLLEMTRQGTPLDVFIRLFLLGVEVTIDEAQAAVSPMDLGSWLDVGVLASAGKMIRAPLRLVPANQMLVAFDPSTLDAEAEARPDHVHGMGMSSINLMNATIRRRVDTALDLGTGCGIQGLMCAQHSRRVIATDVNPRALNITRFNAMLNGLNNIEVREGSRFDPVDGERFDLILVNPPFAITPDRHFLFRDSGMAGDGFVRALLTEAPAHLTEGGFCQMTAQWAHMRGEDWQTRLRRWFDGSRCDAWVVRLKTQNPETYAANWISETEKLSPWNYAKKWNAWMAYFDDRGIEAVSTGMIVLRCRRASDSGFWVTEDAERIGEHAGEAFYNGFLLRDFLEKTPDGELLGLAFKLSSEVRIDQFIRPTAPGWQAEKIVLRHTRGIHYAGNLDGLMIGLLGRCDGKTPLGALVDELAGSMGTDRGDILSSVLMVMRNLIERGVVLPPLLYDINS